MPMKTEVSVDADALADGYPTFGASNGSNSLFRFYSTGDHTDGSDEHHQTDGDSPPSHQRPATKHSGACVHCKALKVRCEPLPGQNTCQRCRDGGHECIPRARKKRKPAPTHEDLQMRALQQDTHIQKLLLQYDQLISSNRIRARVSRAQIEQNATRRLHPQDRFNIMAKGESATEREVLAYFSPTSHINAPLLTPPEIVRYCSLTSSDILDLFNLFFERVNPYFSILDQDYHTPQSLIWTQPFLFTVICSIAARYYSAKPELYTCAHEFARDAAGHALVNGTKSVDTCQAYLLMAVYSPPRKRWEEDRRWILMGVAIRMAQELELNKPSQSYTDREAVNRTRTWLNCFCVDGSHSIQFGKIPMLKLDDPLAKHSKDWYCSSPRNIPFDVHLCAYVQVLVIMAQWRKDTEGNLRQRIREGFDVVNNVIKTEEKLSREMSFWADRYAEQYRLIIARVIAPEICVYRGYTTQLIVAYLRLVVLALGFQYAARSKGLDRSSDVLNRSVECAKSVIRIVIEHLYPTGNLRYAMEANFVYVSFAAAYLVNLLRPKFLPLIEEELQVEIVRIVSQLIEVLGSKAVALDGTHTPALYSRFLKNLMARHSGRSQSAESRPSPEIPGVKDSPRAAYSWPDVRYSESPPSQEGHESSHRSYHDMDMDFSLTHFVRSVTDTPVVPELNLNMPSQWPDPEWQDQAYLPTAGWNNQYSVSNEHWRQ